MKIVNIILSVVILLLAAASAVFSFFLFEKRAQMLSGWNKLAVAIQETSAALDKDSNTQVSKKLDAATVLNHENYGQLDENLKNLNEQAARMVQQRNELAQALHELGTIIQMQNLAAQPKFTAMSDYGAATKDVLAAAKVFRDRRDDLIRRISSSASILGVRVNQNDLASGNAAPVFQQIDNRIRFKLKQISVYQDTLRNIGRVVRVSSPDFSDNGYMGAANTITQGVNNLNNRMIQTERNYRNELEKVRNLTRQLSDRDGKIRNLNTTVGKQNQDIGKLRTILKLPEGPLPELWTDGCPEALRAVRGKVLYINTRYGFYVLDIGKETVVAQTVGNSKNKVRALLKSGMEVMVVRNMDTPEVKYVSRLKLTDVTAGNSVAEVVEGDKENPIEVGDSVCIAPAGGVKKALKK
ncbi:MAG: hypothetical protein PHS41_00880 [Victivallaceae bacterium]|nr:hypothetical protein [Victivallaceae bacterium]